MTTVADEPARASVDAPRVLLVTSPGAPDVAVMPVLAALEAAAMHVRALDVGRAGARTQGLFDGMMKAIGGELAERRLARELAANPPDVALAFDPGSTQVLSLARDQAARPAPVVAVVAELDPDPAWGETDADRYLACDDEAAVALADAGVESERIVTVGAVCEWMWAAAGATPRAALRERFKLPARGPVVVIDAGGLGEDVTGQMALQLSLIEADVTYLFDAGLDSDVSALLRRQVPTLGIRAKLFGDTADRALLWRTADVVVTRPRPATVARALAVGLRVVALMPQGYEEERQVKALEARELGALANTPLLVSSALEPLLSKPVRTDDRVGADGAGTTADVARLVARDRHGVLDESRRAVRTRTSERVRAAASAAEAAERASAPAGDLEDLSGAAPFAEASADAPDLAEITRLRAELSTRMKQMTRAVTEARAQAELWDKKAAQALEQGDADAARQASRRADAERAGMHQRLQEMAQLEAEIRSLEKAERAAREAPPRPAEPPPGFAAGPGPSSTRTRPRPPPQASGPTVDELLDRLKREASTGSATGARPSGRPAGRRSGGAAGASTTVDDELAALKRKMAAKKKKP